MEVWTRLDRFYGDIDTNKVTIKGQLKDTALKGGAPHEKVQALYLAVQTAVTRLDQLGVGIDTLNDLPLIASLVSKLSIEYQDQYDEMETGQRSYLSSEFSRFWTWLQRMYTRAENTHLRKMCMQQSSGGGGAEEKCRLCKGKGHVERYCPVKHLYENGKVQANARENHKPSSVKPPFTGVEELCW